MHAFLFCRLLFRLSLLLPTTHYFRMHMSPVFSSPTARHTLTYFQKDRLYRVRTTSVDISEYISYFWFRFNLCHYYLFLLFSWRVNQMYGWLSGPSMMVLRATLSPLTLLRHKSTWLLEHQTYR